MVGHRQLLLFSCIIWTLSSADLFGGLPDVKPTGIYPPLPLDLDLEVHDQNDVQLIVSNTGQIGLDIVTGNGVGFYPIGTNNNYIFGTGLWIGGIADVDGNGEIDTVFTQGYNPMAGDSEFREGRIGQSQSDPLAYSSTPLTRSTIWSGHPNSDILIRGSAIRFPSSIPPRIW